MKDHPIHHFILPTQTPRSQPTVKPMKRKHPSLHPIAVLCAAFVLLLASTDGVRAATSNPPGKLTYQGFLTDGDGFPFGDTTPENKTVVFRIYDAETGGNIKWSSQQVVTVDKGHFSVLLGEGSSSDDGEQFFSADLSGVFSGSDASDRFLELVVDGTTIAPRLQFLAAPYAFLAKSATQVVDATGAPVLTSSTLNLSGNISADGISANTVSGAGSALTSLNASQLTSGTLPNSRLSGTYGSALTLNNSGNSISGNGSGLMALNASQLTTGTLADARIPNLNASKITSGTLADGRLSSNIAKLDRSATFATFLRFQNDSGFRYGFTKTSGTPGTNNDGYFRFDSPAGYRWYGEELGGNNLMMTLYHGGGLTLHQGTLSEGSDRNMKKNIVPLETSGVLRKVVELPLSEWSYKTAGETRHIGPMAQDFYAAFRLGDSDKTLSARDLAGVSLASVQELHRLVRKQEAELTELRQATARLEALVKRLTDSAGKLPEEASSVVGAGVSEER